MWRTDKKEKRIGQAIWTQINLVFASFEEHSMPFFASVLAFARYTTCRLFNFFSKRSLLAF